MAAVTYSAAVSLILLSVTHACEPLNFKQLKEACDKTRHSWYCHGLIKARHDDLMTRHIYSPQDLARYLMSLATGVAHELAALVRGELLKERSPLRRRCLERLEARVDAAASKLGIVDGELTGDRRETFDLVYRFVQSNAGAWMATWDLCPGPSGTNTTVVYKQEDLVFTFLVDTILALGELPDPPCMAPTGSPSLPPRWQWMAT